MFTVIKKDQNRVSPGAKRQAELREKELLEEKLKAEQEQVKEIMNKHHDTYF